MRVLHVQKSRGIGGSERYLLSLLPALAARGVEVRALVLGAGEVERFVGPLRGAGIETVVVPAGPHANPMTWWRILREIRRYRPDVLHTHLIHADLYGQAAARAAGVPGVCSFHGTHPFYRREPFRSAAWVSCRMARRVIAISHHVEGFLKEVRFARPSNVRVVHYGIEVHSRAELEAIRARARRELGLTSDDVAIGVASRIEPYKGHDFLFDGLALALQKASNLRLLVAGDGSLRAEIEDRARRRFPDGIVSILGFVPDIEAIMCACDAFVFPTVIGFGEGFGRGALEAMAAGRPVVATAVDSLPEIVLDGETGLLVAPSATEELAQALVTLAHDPELRAALGERAYRRAATHFSLDKMVDETIEVYQETRS